MMAPAPPPYSALYWFASTWYSSMLSSTTRTCVPWLPPSRSSLLYMPSSRYRFDCDTVPLATTWPPSKVDCAGFGVMAAGGAFFTRLNMPVGKVREIVFTGRRFTAEELRNSGVFDYIVFRVDRGTVYLSGYSFEGRLKADAEMAAKRASGVDEVANTIEVLPTSQNDDRIRWATFYRIYADDFLSRYARGGVPEVLREIEDERRFPGMQPVGIYPIHIVVKNGRTMLLGVVDNAADRQIAEVRAREVSGVFEVENNLIVSR